MKLKGFLLQSSRETRGDVLNERRQMFASSCGKSAATLLCATMQVSAFCSDQAHARTERVFGVTERTNRQTHAHFTRCAGRGGRVDCCARRATRYDVDGGDSNGIDSRDASTQTYSLAQPASE